MNILKVILLRGINEIMRCDLKENIKCLLNISQLRGGKINACAGSHI